MLTVVFVLVVCAFLCCVIGPPLGPPASVVMIVVASAIGKCPIWVAVLMLCVVELRRLRSVGR